MNLIELAHALRQLRLGGMAAVLEIRLQQAQVEAMAPIDLISCLASLYRRMGKIVCMLFLRPNASHHTATTQNGQV